MGAGDHRGRMTKFRVVCPECGLVHCASWTREENVVVCRGCGARFDYRGHTHRPVTAGMTEEERHERYLEQCRESRERRREDINERARIRYRSMPDEELERRRERARERYREHRDEILSRQRERYASDPEYRERRLSQSREWNREHRHEVKARRVERERRAHGFAGRD